MLTIDDINRSGCPAEFFTQLLCLLPLHVVQTFAYKYEAIDEAIT